MISSLAAIAMSAMLAIDKPIATHDERLSDAVERWAMIARVIGKVGNDPPTEWRWNDEAGKLQLVRSSVTIARHESDFAYSVHVGRKRGGGAVCLNQIDPSTAARFDIEPEALVGVNEEATERCFRAEVMLLARSRSLAEHQCSTAAHWFGPSVAAYGSGSGCVPTGKWAAGVKARERTYALTGYRRPLSVELVRMVGDDT